MAEPYFACGILLHRASGKVLLQLRTDDAPVNPGMWGFFGGGSEPEDGGDPVATWRRELGEELGIELRPEQIVPLWDYLNRNGNHRYVFCCEWPDLSEDFVLGEGAAFAWLGLDEALARPNLTVGTRADLERFRETVTGLGSRP